MRRDRRKAPRRSAAATRFRPPRSGYAQKFHCGVVMTCRLSRSLLLTALLGCCLGLFSRSAAADPPADPPAATPAAAADQPEREVPKTDYPAMAEFLNALALIRTFYVDPEKVSYEALFQAALRGLMHELDPFSNYETPDSFQEAMRDAQGRSEEHTSE